MNQRIYKFRAWDKVSNNMLYPDISHSGAIKPFYRGSFGPLEYGWLSFTGKIVRAERQEIIEEVSNDFELMQFSGLLDKNGKEIYEGDILMNNWKNFGLEKDNKDVKYVVFWENRKASFMLKGLERVKDIIKHINEINLYDTFEVIGNIYEHSELLKT